MPTLPSHFSLPLPPALPLLSRGIETHFNQLDPRSSFLHDSELLIIGEGRNLVALVKGQLCVLAQLRLLNNGRLWLLGG